MKSSSGTWQRVCGSTVMHSPEAETLCAGNAETVVAEVDAWVQNVCSCLFTCFVVRPAMEVGAAGKGKAMVMMFWILPSTAISDSSLSPAGRAAFGTSAVGGAWLVERTLSVWGSNSAWCGMEDARELIMDPSCWTESEHVCSSSPPRPVAPGRSVMKAAMRTMRVLKYLQSQLEAMMLQFVML